MPDNNPTRAKKTPKRLIRMNLPVELVEALKQMGRIELRSGSTIQHRELPEMIASGLEWAVWAHSHGRVQTRI